MTTKACVICQTQFTLASHRQQTCSPECSRALHVRRQRERRKRLTTHVEAPAPLETEQVGRIDSFDDFLRAQRERIAALPTRTPKWKPIPGAAIVVRSAIDTRSVPDTRDAYDRRQLGTPREFVNDEGEDASELTEI